MASPIHNNDANLVPAWVVALLGVSWIMLTLATISYVGAFGPLA